MLNETFCMADLDKRISIVSVETQKTYKGQNRFGKEIKVDLIAQCTDAELVNVEFTMQERKTSANRSIYYLCRIIVDSLSRGDDYSCLSSVTQVNFLNYTPRGIKDDRLVNVMRLMDTNKKSRRVSLTIIDVHMNRILISLKTLHDCNDNVLFKCLYFLCNKHVTEEERMLEVSEEGLKEFARLYEDLMSNQELYKLYRGHKDWERDLRAEKNEVLKEGFEKGMVKGMAEANLEAVLRMHNDRLDLETISRYVGLPVDQVKTIIESQKS